MQRCKETKLKRLRMRRFTLIEVLVSFSLIAILLVILFSAYRNVTASGHEIDRIRDNAFAQRYLQSRLSDVLLNAVAPKSGKKSFHTVTENHSYASGQSLVFVYDNRHQCDTRFAGQVRGRLYRSPNDDLCLATWPLKESQPMRKEVLIADVESLAFSFVSASSERVDEWERDRGALPLLTYLSLTIGGKEVKFAYSHPKGLQMIPYEVL